MKKLSYVFIALNLTVFNCFVFSQTDSGINTYLNRSGEIYRDLIYILNKDYNVEYRGSTTQDSNARNAFTQTMEFYNRDEYEQAINYYIRSCKAKTSLLTYYHLGLCLMDIKEYELAKASFERAITEYENDDGYPLYMEYTFIDLYTYDNNGIIRELYFSYYNIACIESLLNNLDSAYEYLCEALYHGYPYINHIRTDTDLNNLFRDRSRLRSIEAIYTAGSQNTLIGKRFNLNIEGGYVLLVYFQNSSTLYYVTYHQNGRNTGTENYTMRNYIVHSDLFSRTRTPPTDFRYVRQFTGRDRIGKNSTELTESEMAEYDVMYRYLGY